MENEYATGSEVPANNLLGISLEGETRSKLQTIITWSKITAIAGFVNLGINLISTIVTFGAVSAVINSPLLIVIQLIMVAISLSLNYFLWKFGTNLKNSLDTDSQEWFASATMQLRAYMRMLGILLIASIVLGMAGSFLLAGFAGF